jgi:transcriptional regulator with XRE-family HTH domain
MVVRLPMTQERFFAGLKRLGYTAHNGERLIGLSRSTLYRILAGRAEVPMVAVKLLDMYERFGVPEEHEL